MSDPISLLGERHLKAIGIMIVQVSRLESVLFDLATRLMRTDVFDMLALFEHQQFSSKVLSIKALLKLHMAQQPDLSDIEPLLEEASSVGDRRNTVVHCYWSIDPSGTPMSVRYSARGKLKRSRQPMPPEEIEKIAADAVATRDNLVRLINHHFPTASPVP